MADVTRRIKNPLVLGLVAVALVLGLTGCEVKNETLESANGRAHFVKECAPTKTTITATNIGPATRDIDITTNGVLRKAQSNVPTGGVVSWTGTADVTQAQVGFYLPDHSGELITTNMPACGG